MARFHEDRVERDPQHVSLLGHDESRPDVREAAVADVRQRRPLSTAARLMGGVDPRLAGLDLLGVSLDAEHGREPGREESVELGLGAGDLLRDLGVAVGVGLDLERGGAPEHLLLDEVVEDVGADRDRVGAGAGRVMLTAAVVAGAVAAVARLQTVGAAGAPGDAGEHGRVRLGDLRQRSDRLGSLPQVTGDDRRVGAVEYHPSALDKVAGVRLDLQHQADRPARPLPADRAPAAARRVQRVGDLGHCAAGGPHLKGGADERGLVLDDLEPAALGGAAVAERRPGTVDPLQGRELPRLEEHLFGDVELPLGDEGEEAANHLPDRRRRVDLAVAEVDDAAGLLDLLDRVERVRGVAAEPGQVGADDPVRLACEDVGQRPLEAGPFHVAARPVEVFLEAGELPALRQALGFDLLPLHRHRVHLVLVAVSDLRDADVADHPSLVWHGSPPFVDRVRTHTTQLAGVPCNGYALGNAAGIDLASVSLGLVLALNRPGAGVFRGSTGAGREPAFCSRRRLRLGTSGRASARRGGAWRGSAWSDAAGLGRASLCSARRGEARHGAERHGEARPVRAWPGPAPPGMAPRGEAGTRSGETGRGPAPLRVAGPGTAWLGEVGRGRVQPGSAGLGPALAARQGLVRCGAAGPGKARHGLPSARRGGARHGTASPGKARQGQAGFGMGSARRGAAWQGLAPVVHSFSPAIPPGNNQKGAT